MLMRLVAPVLFLLLMSAPVRSEAYFKDAIDLARQCASYGAEVDPVSRTNSDLCLAYVMGVHDTLDAHVFCGEAPDTTPGQLVPIVIQYMRAHPEVLKKAPADAVVRDAIKQAFPSAFQKPSATGD